MVLDLIQKPFLKKRMGIHSIDKRVEHLEDSMTIESEINNEITVIIETHLIT